MLKDKLSEILVDLLQKANGIAVFVFSVTGEYLELVGFSSTELEIIKNYEPEINRKIPASQLNEISGFFKYLKSKVGISYKIDKTGILIHLFQDSDEFEKTKVEEIIADFSGRIESGLSFRKYSLQMKLAEYVESRILLKDFYGNVKYCSPDAAKLFGKGYEKILNANEEYLNCFDIKIKDEFDKHLDDSISAGLSEIILNCKEGSKQAVYKLTSRLIKDEKLIIDILSTVSEEKINKDSLQSKFKELVEAYNDLAFFLDKNGYFQVINNNGAHLLGYKVEEVAGKHFLEFVSDEDKAEIALTFQNILTSRKHLPFEAKLQDNYSNKIV